MIYSIYSSKEHDGTFELFSKILLRVFPNVEVFDFFFLFPLFVSELILFRASALVFSC